MCWLFHKWGRWATYEQRYWNVFYKVYRYEARQCRQCKTCGKVQDRKV
jgi:hypothetical protein